MVTATRKPESWPWVVCLACGTRQLMAPGTVGTCSCGAELKAPGKPDGQLPRKWFRRLDNRIDRIEEEQRRQNLQWRAVWWLIGAIVAGVVALVGGLMLR